MGYELRPPAFPRTNVRFEVSLEKYCIALSTLVVVAHVY
jgi:hypothetical protein